MNRFFKLFFLFFFFIITCNAEFISVLSDDESETFLQNIVDDIKNSLNYDRDIEVFISNSFVLNACANQSSQILINVGAILECENVDELIAILSHEVGHVVGEHVTTFMTIQPQIMKAGLVTTLIGAAAAVLTANPLPLMAGVTGGQSMSNQMALGAIRQRENIADSKAADAMKILEWPVMQGFVSIHNKLAKGDVLFNDYLSTHPSSIKRISKYQDILKDSKKASIEKQEYINKLNKQFIRIKQKLEGVCRDSQEVLKKYKTPKNDNEKLAKAIGLYKNKQYVESNKILDSISQKNPYDLEVKTMNYIGLLKYQNAANTAWEILKNDKKIKIHRDLAVLYAQAVIQGNLDKKLQTNAIKLLRKALIKNKAEIAIYHTLGKLYYENGQAEKATLCTAEKNFLIGDFETALFHAKKLEKSSINTILNQAKDIICEIKKIQNTEKTLEN